MTNKTSDFIQILIGCVVTMLLLFLIISILCWILENQGCVAEYKDTYVEFITEGFKHNFKGLRLW